MATRPSLTGPWPADAAAARGALATFSANAQAGVNTMPTSEVTIACGVLLGRKLDAFSDRASRCGASSPRASHASRRTRSRASEQPEAVAQPPCDLLREERTHPGGGQLERQRPAVQRPADPQHRAHGASSTLNYPPQHPRS